MSQEWTYRVPKLHGSRWAGLGGPLTSAALEWPRIGVFCDAESHDSIWLLGSFVDDQAGWRWESKYPTGDGHLIHLHWKARENHDLDPSTQYIVDDRPHEPQRESEALKAAVESEDFDEMRRVLAQQEHARSVMRSRPILECTKCGDRLVTRADGPDAVLEQVWKGGIREVSLGAARFIFSRAKA